MSFELSFQKSFDASLRWSSEASDVRSNALNLETSDARSDVKSNEMSDGRSDEVSLRISVLRYFPANSETSFLASFEGSFQGRVWGRVKHLSGQFAGRSLQWQKADDEWRLADGGKWTRIRVICAICGKHEVPGLAAAAYQTLRPVLV
jgi:hypothetical protein